MSKNREFKKNKLIGTLSILFGIMAIFTYIILYKGGVIHKNNFTEGITKQVAIVNKKIRNNAVAVNETKKNKELEEIRAEVEKSKAATVEKEKLATEEIKKQTIEANKKGPIDANGKENKKKSNGVALAKVNDELGDAYSQVETPKEQQIIGAMRSTVSKLEADPSYDSSADQASVKAMYHKLDEDSKNRIKIALFINVDSDSIAQLRQTFGL